MRTAAGGHRLPHVRAPGHTCSHTCTQGSTCHVLLGRLSPAGEPHFRVPREQAAAGERGESEEEREPLGRQEVHRASGCRRRFGLAAEGGGGEGSDFLALGWLLGVGLSDYRGAGTQPAGTTGIMRCLPKRRNPLEHRESYTIPAWNWAHGLSLPWRKQPGPFSLAMWVGGWPHRAWWLQGSSPGQQAQQPGPGPSDIRVGESKASLQS